LRRRLLTGTYDIAVIGSGFAGSLIAAIARQLGHSVVLIEKGTHPRIVIGESSTPLSNLLLEELTARYNLPALRPLSKWGTWQRTYPHIACGLKRGFTFHHHILDAPQPLSPTRDDQLLVAASPRDAIADTHWFRADFDQLLVREARAVGVDFFDQTILTCFSTDGSASFLEGHRHNQPLQFRAQFVIDATGPRGFLHHALSLGERELPNYPPTQALYSHFSGVGRLEETPHARTPETPPYPIDDAAMHHVFPGGWVWVLHFSNGITSAGLAATDACASQLQISEGEPAWSRLLNLIPALSDQFSAAQPVRPFTHIRRLSFRSAQIAGPRWALLPSAAGFVDPLLSTGFPLTLLGVSRLAAILADDWQSPRFAPRLQQYAAQTDAELLATARLIAALYASMDNFPLFTALSLFYFAAASFSEAARRLGKPHLASSFLLCDHPRFGSAFRELTGRAQQPLTSAESAALIRDIFAAIEPIDVAGLTRSDRRNWHPVDADDLLSAAAKLGATQEEIRAMLHRCGFLPCHPERSGATRFPCGDSVTRRAVEGPSERSEEIRSLRDRPESES